MTKIIFGNSFALEIILEAKMGFILGLVIGMFVGRYFDHVVAYVKVLLSKNESGE